LKVRQRKRHGRRGGGETVNRTANRENDHDDGDIHFDADLLIKALRYHLEEGGLAAGGMLSHREGSGIHGTVSRRTWAILSDEQRLAWLLKASRAEAEPSKGPPGAQSRPWTERQNT
jgi:hypothetical protein